LSGLDLQSLLHTEGRRLPIIFMTGHATIPMTVQAMKGGALEFLTKPIDEDQLFAAVREALERHRADLERERGLAELRTRLALLTPREGEVLRLVINGGLNKQLAGALGTSEITAKVHKRRVMEKMGARTLVELVHMAERLGITATPL
jgi:FixJ family two-component response regulator